MDIEIAASTATHTLNRTIAVPVELFNDIRQVLGNVGDYVSDQLDTAIDCFSLNGMRLPYGDCGDTDSDAITNAAIALSAVTKAGNALCDVEKANEVALVDEEPDQPQQAGTSAFKSVKLPRTIGAIEMDMIATRAARMRLRMMHPPHPQHDVKMLELTYALEQLELELAELVLSKRHGNVPGGHLIGTAVQSITIVLDSGAVLDVDAKTITAETWNAMMRGLNGITL